MISTHLACVKWPNYLGANVPEAALKFRKRKENWLMQGDGGAEASM